VDFDRRLAWPFSYAFAIQTSLRAICIQIALLFSCEAPRIALRTPGDAQGTRVKRIHNSSLIFPHLSRAPLFQCNVLSFSLFLPPFLFLTRAKWQKEDREREKERERESPFRVQRSHARFPRCQRNIHHEHFARRQDV
jgi:hypothetical protein